MKPTGRILLSFIALISSAITLGQVPAGFNYQAVARDAAGVPIANEKIKVRVAILYTVTPENVAYEAEYLPTTNQFGLFQFMIGDPLATPVSGSFSEVNWTAPILYVRTKVYWNNTWQDMGSSRLLSVPYALVSQGVSGLNKLSLSATAADTSTALFEVKNTLGQTVFAVYNEGVRVSVGTGAKATGKGGFSIGGFGGAKGEAQQYLKVYPDSTYVFTRNPQKGFKGGFAIGGFDNGKGSTGSYLNVTPLNYFIGHESGNNISSGTHNATLGYQSGKGITTGLYNVFIGNGSGINNTGGSYNVFVGNGTGNGNTSQYYNSFVGHNAGYYNTGWFNSYIGCNSGFATVSGGSNTYLGTNSGRLYEKGSFNTFIGTDAGEGGPGDVYNHNTTAINNYNTAIGFQAGNMIEDGDFNLYAGSGAGANNINGSGNVFLGYNAGMNETGSSKLYIANSETNPLIYGDFAGKKLGVNTQTLNKTLNVGGDLEVTGAITAGSVNGASMGSVNLTETGNIVSIKSGTILLNWEATGDWIEISNTSNMVCSYWYKKQDGTTATSASSSVAASTNKKIISAVNITNAGFEIHFSAADGSGTCSVWLINTGGRLTGHYVKF